MQNKIIIGLALTVVILVFIPFYWATEPGRHEAARAQMKAEAVERGAGLYSSQCALCHGPDGEGGVGPALQGTPLDDETLHKTIARGVAGTAMPAFDAEEGGPLAEHEITDLVTFIKNWESGLLVTEPAEPATPPAGVIEDSGGVLYSNSCAACHGPAGEGTAIGPRVAGHSASAVKLQVRNPLGTMPSFSESQISDEELESIAVFIESLGEPGAPAGEWEKAAPETIHLWMALVAASTDDATDARHHIEDALTFIQDPDKKAELEEALELIEQGNLHDAAHEIEHLAGSEPPPGIVLQQFHLVLASHSLEEGDNATARHHLEHFMAAATGEEKTIARQAIELAERGEFHEAEHEIEELLEVYTALSSETAPPAGPSTSTLSGLTLFNQRCSGCHNIGGGDRPTGPDLQNVTERRERDWLLQMITAPDQLIGQGDPIARALVEEYILEMPNLGLSHEEAEKILAYIEEVP